MKRYYFLLMFFLILSVPYIALAGMGMGGGHRGQGVDREPRPAQAHPVNLDNNIREILTFDKELNLTTGQIESIMKIRSDLMKEAQKSYQDVAITQQELSELLRKDTPDFAGARAKAKDITDLAAYPQSLSIDYYEKAYNILTADQKKKLVVLRAEQRKKVNDDNFDTIQRPQPGH